MAPSLRLDEPVEPQSEESSSQSCLDHSTTTSLVSMDELNLHSLWKILCTKTRVMPALPHSAT